MASEFIVRFHFDGYESSWGLLVSLISTATFYSRYRNDLEDRVGVWKFQDPTLNAPIPTTIE